MNQIPFNDSLIEKLNEINNHQQEIFSIIEKDYKNCNFLFEESKKFTELFANIDAYNLNNNFGK